jgi:hypothetical protein
VWRSRLRRRPLALAGVLALLLASLSVGVAAASSKHTSFEMVASAGVVAANCARGIDPKMGDPEADVTIRSLGPVEVMDVTVKRLVPNAEYDLFVLQVPNAPFGVGWYQGDIETNSSGWGHERFIGRFSVETFALAPGSAPAPQVFPGDATTNPPFAPVQMYHLGLWFGSPQVAAKAGCPTTTTPFNGEHNAGIQVLSTRNFPNDQGPLRQIQP